MPAAAQLIDATKKYGAVEALKGVTLDIELGDVVAMLGPNGAGKTTSISLLLGLRKPTSGKALLFALDPTHLDARSRVGVMLQESGIPAMLKSDAVIDTNCADCGEQAKIRVSNGAVAGSGFMHFVVPPRLWWMHIVYT